MIKTGRRPMSKSAFLVVLLFLSSSVVSNAAEITLTCNGVRNRWGMKFATALIGVTLLCSGTAMSVMRGTAIIIIIIALMSSNAFAVYFVEADNGWVYSVTLLRYKAGGVLEGAQIELCLVNADKSCNLSNLTTIDVDCDHH